MALTRVFLFQVLALLFAVSYASGETIRLTGKAQFWVSEMNNQIPTIPRKIGMAKNIDFKISKPVEAGTVTYEILNFAAESLKASVKYIWKRPADAKEYIIQQIELYDSNGKLIALCTSYQLPKNITPIGVGACSGRYQNLLAGISLMQN